MERNSIKETKTSLLMKSLSKYYNTNKNHIEEVKSIINQKNDLSLRILDWFVTQYTCKHRTIITNKDGKDFDVYINYKLTMDSFSKQQFDPFCRKNKIVFYYDKDKSIETSCGQLCFFRWCFQNDILPYVRKHLKEIETEMKSVLKERENDKHKIDTDTNKKPKRKRLTIPASRSITKRNVRYTITFD